jgi:UDP-glucose 4-epimerase
VKRKILVTGGAGFIGSNIAEELVKKGKSVVVLDDLSTGFLSHLKSVKKDIHFIKGDIRNPSTVKKALKRVDIVIHQAAIRSVPKSVDDPFLSNSVNVTGTLVLLDQSLRQGVRRFVCASSSSVYGDVHKFPQTESDKLHPLSPYGASKLVGEHYCSCYFHNFGLQTVSLRYFNVYGPHQNPESKYSAVVPAFISCLRNGKKPVIDGTGKQSRDFTYVKDVVSANLRSAFASSRVAGETFNVAGGKEVSVLQILRDLAKIMRVRAQLRFGPSRKGDAMRTYASISKAQRLLGWKPQFTLDQGLKRTVAWFEEKPSL